MKKGLVAFNSNQVAALRLVIAGLFLLPFGIIQFRKWHPSKLKYFFAVGLFGNFIPAFLFTLAETKVSSSLAGLLNSLTPTFTLVLGMLFFGMTVRKNHILGIILGFIGAAVLIIGPGMAAFNEDAVFGLLVVLATVFYGISVNVIRKHLSEVNSITTTFWAFMLTSPFAGAYLLTTDVHLRLSSPEGYSSLSYIAILGIVGTASAVMLFNMLIRNTNAIFASSVTYLIPIVALGWGILDNEEVGLIHLLAISLILGGIFLINRKSSDENRQKIVENPKKA